MRKKISMVGNSGALLLSRDMLGLLNAKIGDEVEVSFSGEVMTVRPIGEDDRRAAMAAAFNKSLSRHGGALRRLATVEDDRGTSLPASSKAENSEKNGKRRKK